MSSRFQIVPRGRFSLAQSIGFGFGQRDASSEPVMRLGFVLDGYASAVGVALRQLDTGELDCVVTGSDDIAAVQAHVQRVLSLDVDATGWDELGQHDSLVGALQAAKPGLRPPLFYSAYEALAWSVLSARRPQKQMAAVRDRLATEHGTVIEVAGEPMAVMPLPEQLLAVETFPGLDEMKMQRLHGVAQAALDGHLDTQTLRELEPAEAMQQVQQLKGIGPFYATLVVVRTLGHTDVVATGEPRLLKLAGELTGKGRPLTDQELVDLAEPWRPWRTWATVAIRAAGASVVSTGV